MKKNRLALVLVIAALSATPALAASMTMVQFGSFETREEAEKHLAAVAAKHKAEIGALATNIREVKLPPDNLTVYRTQAGPLENRAAAQSVCSKFASVGDECYIVQTAMMNPSDMRVASNDTAQPAPVATTTATGTKADTGASNNVIPTPMAGAAPVAPASARTGTAASASASSSVPPLASATIPPRDPSNRAALASINGASLTPVTQSPNTGATPSPQLQAALDKATAEQEATAAKVDQEAQAVAATTAKTQKTSFWSRMNPFSEEPAAKPAAAPKAPQPASAPVEAVGVASVAPAVDTSPMPPAPMEPLPSASVTPTPMAGATPASVTSFPPVPAAPLAAQTPVMSPAPAPIEPAPMVASTLPTEAEPLRLPPPPAPLMAQNPTLSPAPASMAPVATGSLAAPMTVANTAGTVRVEEAKRVPVTNMTSPPPVFPAPMPPQAMPMQPIPVMPPTPPLQAPVSLVPSSTNGEKTVWAQIGPFANNDAALSYWASYRQMHPDFPVVRVRVTTPLRQANNSNASWLRVGPVANAAFTRYLCSGVTPQSGLRCGHVTDMGIASSGRTNKTLPSSRYHR